MTRSNASPQALRRVLQQELLLGKRLLTLSEEESEAIMRQNVTRLNELQAAQQQCLQEQRGLEQSRVAMTRELAWMVGIDKMPTLIELIVALPAREQDAYRTLREELLRVQQQLDLVNARNRRLLDNAMEYVRFSLDLLTTAVLQPARYGTNLAHLNAPTFYIDSKA